MALNTLDYRRTDHDEMGLFCGQDGNAAPGNRRDLLRGGYRQRILDPAPEALFRARLVF